LVAALEAKIWRTAFNHCFELQLAPLHIVAAACAVAGVLVGLLHAAPTPTTASAADLAIDPCVAQVTLVPPHSST